MLFGILHLLHCPCLILLPYYVKNPIFDLLYIEYFLGIMFSYTFINGECPISYIYKKRKDPNYIAGSRITDYLEMNTLFFFSPTQIQYFFGTTTILYMGTLIYVIYRNNISFALFMIPTNSLLVYFTFVYRYPGHPLFHIIQNMNKIILFLFMLCLIRREIYV